ncbi:MAG: hypothetical protein RL149_232, partial [Actinomycetota bacterium]
MRLWQRPQRFVSLVKKKSVKWLNATMSTLLVAASILPGAVDPATAAAPPANFYYGPCSIYWQSYPSTGFNVGDLSLTDASGGGHGDAYDGFGTVTIGGSNTYASGTPISAANDASVSGSTLLTPYVNGGTQTYGSFTVNVQEKFMSNYAAMREIINVTNTSASAQSTYIQVYGNLGSDGSETQTTSDGDTLYETTDNWVVSRDSGNYDPVLSWAFSDSSAATRINTHGKSGDNQFFIWNLTVPANSTRSIMLLNGFAGVNSCTNTDTAAISGQSIWSSGTSLPAEFKNDLTGTQLGQIVNWTFAPSVSSFAPTTATPTNTATVSYALTLSQSVSDLALADFDLTGSSATGCTPANLQGSGASYTLDLTGCSEGNVILNLKANSITGSASSTGPLSAVAASTVVVDRTAPTISVFSQTSGTTNTTRQVYSLTFSEAIQGLDASDIVLTGASATTGTWTKTISGSGAGPYTITIDNLNAIDGAWAVQIPAGAVTDLANNSLAVASSQYSKTLSLLPSIAPGTLNTFGAGTITLAPSATLIDRGSSALAGLKISITGNAQAADSLTFTNNNATNFGTIQSATSTSQVLTLTYSGAQPTLAQWQNAIRAVKFTTSTAGASRTIEFHLKPTTGYNYDNMHFYQWVPTSLSTGDLAISAAAGYSYKGMSGYLTTITSATENAFVYALSGNLGTWLGATQVSASSNNWKWTTGPEANTQFSSGATSYNSQYVNWWSGEPNNSANYVFMTTAGTWDDLVSSQSGAYYASGYVVEYGGLTTG